MEMLRIIFLTFWTLLRWSAILLKLSCKYGFRGLRALLRARPTTHGSARWARLSDLTRGKALGGNTGIIVGKKFGLFLRFKKDGAVMVTAPMGKGKGVGIVIPNLLDHQGSVLVTDPKGENFAITQRYRSTLGPVWRLDAIHPTESHCFNPLSMIRVGTYHEADDALQIASFLVISESREAHWDTAAKNLIVAVIRYVLHSEPTARQTLATVRELVAGGDEQQRHTLSLMASCPLPSVAEEARVILAGFDADDTGAVLRNAAKALAFWSKDRVGGLLTRTTDFDMMDLHREGMSIYVMIPDDNIENYTSFLRMMTGCAVAALMRGKDRPRPRHKPMLLIDECKALGRLDALAKGMGMLREYCHTVLIWQDLGQLREVYGDNGARTFTAASGAQVTFGVSDTATARGLAEDIGRTTVYARSQGTSTGNLDLVRAQLQGGLSEAGRYLKDPAEIRHMDPNRCIVILQDQVSAPIRATKVRYYKEFCWRGRYDSWRDTASVLNFDPPRPHPNSGDDMSSVAS